MTDNDSGKREAERRTMELYDSRAICWTEKREDIAEGTKRKKTKPLTRVLKIKREKEDCSERKIFWCQTVMGSCSWSVLETFGGTAVCAGFGRPSVGSLRRIGHQRKYIEIFKMIILKNIKK